MSLQAVLNQMPDAQELCAVALERKSLAALSGAALILCDPSTRLDPKSILLYIETLIEAGKFETAANWLASAIEEGQIQRGVAASLVARIARRTRIPASILNEDLHVKSVNSWLGGDLVLALNFVELILLEDQENLDAILLKALILADEGFLDQSKKIASQLSARSPHPLAQIEILALETQIALDGRSEFQEPFAKFRASISMPAVSSEAEPFLDQLEISLLNRMGNSAKKTALIAKAPITDWTLPNISNSRGNGISENSRNSLRCNTALKILQATRLPHSEAKVMIEKAIHEASKQELIAPFLEFGSSISSTICEVASGQHTRFSERLLQLFVRPLKIRTAPINKRELLVMQLFSSGLSVTEIARDLVISRETVKSHSHHVLGKLGVKTRAEALALLKDQGLLS